MYVRFGALPETGRSRNDETGAFEAGVSVYRAEWQSSDKDVICISVPNEGCIIGTTRQIEDRPLYIVTGDVLDERGSDGEPLMTGCAATLHGPVEIVNYAVED